MTTDEKSPALAEPFAAILNHFLAASREAFARQGEESATPERDEAGD